MQKNPGDDVKPVAEAPVASATAPAASSYVKPELVEYGPLAKLTQGQAGSTGEGSNAARRMCL